MDIGIIYEIMEPEFALSVFMSVKFASTIYNLHKKKPLKFLNYLNKPFYNTKNSTNYIQKILPAIKVLISPIFISTENIFHAQSLLNININITAQSTTFPQ